MGVLYKISFKNILKKLEDVKWQRLYLDTADEDPQINGKTIFINYQRLLILGTENDVFQIHLRTLTRDYLPRIPFGAQPDVELMPLVDYT